MVAGMGAAAFIDIWIRSIAEMPACRGDVACGVIVEVVAIRKGHETAVGREGDDVAPRTCFAFAAIGTEKGFSVRETGETSSGSKSGLVEYTNCHAVSSPPGVQLKVAECDVAFTLILTGAKQVCGMPAK